MDPYDEWLATPAAVACSDPRFAVRQIREHEYERVWVCVDEAFGTKRPHAVYDWLYRKNPYGRARIWAVEERATGRILKTGATFPWPVWRGTQSLGGGMSGDDGTVPDWQRKGIGHVRREVTRSHSWRGRYCVIAGPNANSRAVSKALSEADKVIGCLKGGVVALRALPSAERSRTASALASVANGVTGAALSAWHAVALGNDTSRCRLEEIDRFTPEFDAITLRTMSFSGYWCPHSSEFLNWRYLDRPLEDYHAFALLEADRAVGYSVLRVAGSHATIAEFAVAEQPRSRSIALLRGTLEVAREAGCAYVNFFGPPAWRHWGLFRRAGMVPYPTNNYFEVSFRQGPADAKDFHNWQITPGDRDYH